MDDIFSFIETGHLARDLHGPTGASRTMFANIGTDDTDSEAEILHSVGTTAHGDETDERDQSQARQTSRNTRIGGRKVVCWRLLFWVPWMTGAFFAGQWDDLQQLLSQNQIRQTHTQTCSR